MLRRPLSHLVACCGRSVVSMFVCCAVFCLPAGPAFAQQPSGAHYMYPSQTPPGQVGAQRLQRGGPVVGYFQPVSFSTPGEVTAAMSRDGGWTESTHDVIHTGLLIGQTYRLKLSNLPLHEGRDCYPTVEIIDRTYPPAGMELKFPIPIVFNDDDIRLAMDGMYVTRVVYVEDPQLAIPGGQRPGEQLWHDAGAHANPLQVADQLGRPVAIVRMGARVPVEGQGPDWEFLYGCPKWQFFGLTPPVSPIQLPPKAAPVQPGIIPNTPVEAPPKSARRFSAAENN